MLSCQLGVAAVVLGDCWASSAFGMGGLGGGIGWLGGVLGCEAERGRAVMMRRKGMMSELCEARRCLKLVWVDHVSVLGWKGLDGCFLEMMAAS